MKTESKNRKNKFKDIDLSKTYSPMDALKLLKEISYVKFEESIDIAIKLGIDASKTDQNIRGVVNLPKGSGKKIKVAVMAKGDKAKEASDAGADLVGDNDIVDMVNSNKISFDLLIATPDMMPTIGKIGKILGPKGLMPNPKLGTVTQDVSKAVKEAKSGQIQFKNDKAGIVHAGIGKLNFKDEDLLENIKAFYATINKSKPDSVKGSFIKKVTIASTMGLGLVINVGDLRS
ncbi:MAG: 50S ribosomal protein L1 [Alphaproteobacteria bacterium MarineAlpha5_Bin8]|nr:MAG: 50S ribosomal protein L1 [Alphaproteobacteria bacterium MarineAlpha5_Bin7]PPR48060.1 MAG: 50S ribosomal protein L1 [Alphaproteobacteria bacterium MarineAlpha5_Bin8]|tara:strand:+ start:1739 stop:2434 length:696 start_codon:yes stop_codon:yes gene_type:complete